MRRSATVAFMLVLLAAGAAAAGPPGKRGAAYVRLTECSDARDLAVFRARMRWLPGTERMSMRFVLLKRSDSGRYGRVRTPGLRGWRTSRTGVRAFGFRQRVKGLAEDATYKARVHFRWLDPDGEVLMRAVRRSSACGPPFALADLSVTDVRARPTSAADVLLYKVTVANNGTATAVRVPVRLLVDGDLVGTETVGPLRPGEERTVRFRGPACARQARAVADPGQTVPESSLKDNGRAVLCRDL